ncbi:MAG: hypothetical protein E7656_06620 [Ruminococcaceae bacterium]|nr:hypothetical protein [Oscillospiraceae bacterium]
MTRFKRILAFSAAALVLTAACSCEKKAENTDGEIADSMENTEHNEQNDINVDGIDSENEESTDVIPETDDQKEQEQEEEIPPVVEPTNPFEGETLESFYNTAAFVGDSVMHGLQLYSARGVTATTNSTFLTLSSFAARHALSDVTEKSYHPLYEGEKMKTEDALAIAGVDKVFISLGLNDVRVTPKTYYENYVEFIGKIKEKCPDIKIFIVSTTYPVESPNPNKMDRATALDYRNQLYDLNFRLNAWCAENGGYFVDVMSPIISENGFLADEYTSDNYVHLTNKAYTIWEQTLIDYATVLIETGKAPVSFPAIPLYVTEEPATAPVIETEPTPDAVTESDTAPEQEATYENTTEVTNEN